MTDAALDTVTSSIASLRLAEGARIPISGPKSILASLPTPVTSRKLARKRQSSLKADKAAKPPLSDKEFKNALEHMCLHNDSCNYVSPMVSRELSQASTRELSNRLQQVLVSALDASEGKYISKVLLPIANLSHWCLLVIDYDAKTLVHYDTLSGRKCKAASDMSKALKQELPVPKVWRKKRGELPGVELAEDSGKAVACICNMIITGSLVASELPGRN